MMPRTRTIYRIGVIILEKSPHWTLGQYNEVSIDELGWQPVFSDEGKNAESWGAAERMQISRFVATTATTVMHSHVAGHSQNKLSSRFELEHKLRRIANYHYFLVFTMTEMRQFIRVSSSATWGIQLTSIYCSAAPPNMRQTGYVVSNNNTLKILRLPC